MNLRFIETLLMRFVAAGQATFRKGGVEAWLRDELLSREVQHHNRLRPLDRSE